MTERELVRSSLEFRGIDRLPQDLQDGYESDFVWQPMEPWIDMRLSRNGLDEWGAYWENIGVCNVGEVKAHPIQDWSDLRGITIPDVEDPARWEAVNTMRRLHPNKFLLGFGQSLYERIHFLRGLENTWIDIIEDPDALRSFLDRLVALNEKAIARYAAADFDAMIIWDDWGLQNTLMISPEAWRQIWKPAYRAVFDALHAKGMKAILHSCGYIVDILDDLIEIGLDAIQMDQQENMTLELLGSRFRGRINFFCPVDVQRTMAQGDPQAIRAYVFQMGRHLLTERGGLIAKSYPDPVGAGHTPEAVRAMGEAFMELSRMIEAGDTSLWTPRSACQG